MGDIVLTTPIIRCVKKQFRAEVHVLTKTAYTSLLEQNPYIDRILTLQPSLLHTITEVRREKYDLIIDLHKNIRSRFIAIFSGSASIRYDKLNFSKWLMVRFKINRLPTGKHLVDRYFEALKMQGISDDGMGLDFFIKPEDADIAKQMVSGITYQVLILGATYYTKRIPVNKCEEIISSTTLQTVLLGGKDVLDIAKVLAVKYPQKVLNFCGTLNVGTSAAIIKDAKRVYSGDTGMMHIAAALQKGLVVLWGSTIPEFGMYPYYGQQNIPKHSNLEVKGLSCRPCSKLGFDACPEKHFRCMNDIHIPS
jgi:ADP-heptose:LPS heptosyltransferase